MKSQNLLLVFTIVIQAPSALSQLLLSQFFSRISLSLNPSPHQAPINQLPNIIMPPPSTDNNSSTSSVIISDIITRERTINIFAGFTRSIDTISSRLDSPSTNTTVLAPLNSALQSLPRKPWEDPQDYEELGANAYGGSEGEGRAQRNLRRFVEAHVVPVSPWKEGEKVKTVGGGEVWWEEREGGKIVCICFGELEGEKWGAADVDVDPAGRY